MKRAVMISAELREAVLRAAKDPTTSSRDLLALARRASSEGARDTADALIARAEKASVGAATPGPISETDPDGWKKLTTAIRSAAEPRSEETGRVGAYGLSVRRLCDLGICKRPRKVGRKWEAEWPASLPREKFEGNEKLQEEALARSLGAYADEVRSKYGAALGKEVNGQAVTLSGLVGVAHVAGTKGLETWLRDGEVRAKFPGTTKMFEATNGIF